jgi:hypothetical protein
VITDGGDLRRRAAAHARSFLPGACGTMASRCGCDDHFRGSPGMAGCSVSWLGAVVVMVACWLLDVLGVSGLTLNQMLIVNAAYCGLLGFAVACRTILRQLPR